MVADSVRTLASWTAYVGLAALVALVLMAVGLGLLGPVNDVLGAVTGVLAVLLALAMRDLLPEAVVVRLPVLAVALLGGAGIVLGSVLVLTATTGWYLAGLWTALGWGLLGVWFLVLVLAVRASGGSPTGLTALGVGGALFLVVGLGVLPGIVRGVDAWEGAGWLVLPQALGALGSLLFLVWCFLVGRAADAAATFGAAA